MSELRVEDLDFPLPKERIARWPAADRELARMLVVRGAGAAADCAAHLEHRSIREFGALLRAGDLLVLNDTRVVPARLLLRKLSGGAAEGLWLATEADGRARIMLSGARLREGTLLSTESGGSLRLFRKHARGEWTVERADHGDDGWERWLQRHGNTPLPPYVRRLRASAGEPQDTELDRERYQTVWARADGSVAAPTASLHFDQALLEQLRADGVEVAWLTLHVGQGTFLPVSATTLSEHEMHAESFAIPEATVRAIQACRVRGGRVIAAGTTVCRALEAGARNESGDTQLLIAPGHDWRVVDALLTNFHTPRSTLLALVAAFAERIGAEDGLAFVKAVYARAIALEYRFYSFGDATFWLPSST